MIGENVPVAPPKPRFGVKIVTAWFETVINPVLNGLAVESHYLSKKNWTWQFMPGRLESIRTVAQMIPAGYLPNLEQFLKYHSPIGENIKFHDDNVAQLFVACGNLQRAILGSSEFKRIFSELTTDAALNEVGKTLKDLFFTDNDETLRLGWIAQEIINGTERLPSYINHSSLWNRYRDDFMRVLDDPGINVEKLGVDAAGGAVLQMVDRLIQQLSETRDQLSLEYDVPPVPTASTAAA